MPTRCVIYDCDGVLFDSLEANRALYNHIAVSMGRGPITEEELRCCHTSTVRESVHCLFKDDPEGEARGLQFLSDQIDFRDYIPYLRMEPHVLETIATLKERGLSRPYAPTGPPPCPTSWSGLSSGPISTW